MSRQATNQIHTFGTSVVAVAGNVLIDASGLVTSTVPPDNFSFSVAVSDQANREYVVTFADSYNEYLCAFLNCPITGVQVYMRSFSHDTGEMVVQLQTFAGVTPVGALRFDVIGFFRNSSTEF
jgi:hypothetical protein